MLDFLGNFILIQSHLRSASFCKKIHFYPLLSSSDLPSSLVPFRELCLSECGISVEWMHDALLVCRRDRCLVDCIRCFERAHGSQPAGWSVRQWTASARSHQAEDRRSRSWGSSALRHLQNPTGLQWVS